MRITDIIWKRQFVDKIEAKHGVPTEEAEEALYSTSVFRRVAKGRVKGEDLYAALGKTDSGRHLTVFYIDKGGGAALPISARDMDRSERRYYDKHR